MRIASLPLFVTLLVGIALISTAQSNSQDISAMLEIQATVPYFVMDHHAHKYPEVGYSVRNKGSRSIVIFGRRSDNDFNPTGDSMVYNATSSRWLYRDRG